MKKYSNVARYGLVFCLLLAVASSASAKKKVQAKLFDTFLQAAFLYDKKLTLVFNFTGTRNRIEVPIENLIDDDAIEVLKSEIDTDMIRPSETKGHQIVHFYIFDVSYNKKDTEMLVNQASPYFFSNSKSID